MSEDYFEEKSQQVIPDTLSAFGIDIVSRYGKAGEIIQMINFARQAALNDVAHYVKEIFYDSKAGLCTFKFAEEVSLGDPVERQLREIALATIRSFDWFDALEMADVEIT